MKKTIPNQYAITSTWVNYLDSVNLPEEQPQQIALILHNSQESNLSMFELNLSLLKLLRIGLNHCSRIDFFHYFSLSEHEDEFRTLGDLREHIRKANDESLASLAPSFGGLLFKLQNQQKLLQTINEKPLQLHLEAQELPFYFFQSAFWTLAWHLSKQSTTEASMALDLSVEWTKKLENMTFFELFTLVHSHLRFQFSIEISPAVLALKETQMPGALTQIFLIERLLSSHLTAHSKSSGRIR